METLNNTLNLTKIKYKVSAKITFDKVNSFWVGQIDMPDLAVVFNNPDKTALELDMNKAVEMHCYISSMDAIDLSLTLNKHKSNKKKASVNILIPCVA